jgi:hypothetical protein
MMMGMLLLHCAATLGVALAFSAEGSIPKPPAASGKWRLTVNIGREPGAIGPTAMPAEWAASGARLLLRVDVDVSERMDVYSGGIKPLLTILTAAARNEQLLDSLATESDAEDHVGRGAKAIEPRPREGREADGLTAAFTGDQGEVCLRVCACVRVCARVCVSLNATCTG